VTEDALVGGFELAIRDFVCWDRSIYHSRRKL